MSISSLLRRHCNQTIIYWEYLRPDGYGGVEYKDPVEMKCRWDDTSEVVAGGTGTGPGTEFASKAQITTFSNMKMRSRVMLGTLQDIDKNKSPERIDGTHEIRRVDRHPGLGLTTNVIYTAYL